MRVLVLGHSLAYGDFARARNIDLINVLDSHALRIPGLDLQVDPIVVGDRTSIGEILAAVHRRGLVDKVDAVFTNSEACAITAAALAGILGADGVPVATAVAMRDKSIQKSLVRAAGIPVAGSVVIAPSRSLQTVLPAFRYPAVVKPLAAAATRGVTRIRDRAHLEEVLRAVRHAVEDPGATWLLEEFVDGAEFHLDGLVLGGRIEFLSVGRYAQNCLHVREGKLTGSTILDPRASDEDYGRFHEFADRSLQALGVRSSVFHMEAFDTSAGLVFSECAARCGGGLILPCIRYRFGVELELAAFQVAATGTFSPPSHSPEHPCVGWSYLPAPPGRITRLPDLAEMAAMTGVLSVEMKRFVGDELWDGRHEIEIGAGGVIVAGDNLAQVQERIGAFTQRFADETEILPLRP